MANTKVTGDVIANGTISTVHIADDAITAAKLDSTATGITFADLAVDTDTLYVDSSNNRVGIGTTSPVEKLDVDGSINLIGGQIYAAADGSNTFFANAVQHIFRAGSSGSYAERMRIRPSGTVGIGAAGFDSVMLTIAAGTLDSAIYATSTDANCFASFRDNSSTANIEYGAIGNAHVFRKDTSEYMRIDDNGNVGIGTSSPDTLLHIYNPDTNWGAYSVITLGTDVEGTNQAQLKYYRGASTSTESFQLSVRGTTALTALYNGNVGIGTDLPNSNLQVVGSAQDQIRFGTNTSVYTDLWMGTGYTVFDSIGGNSGAFDFRDDGSSRMFIDSSGNVGIGTTSPAEKLTVDGNLKVLKGDDARIYINDVGDSSTILLRSDGSNTSIGTDSNHDLQIHTNGGERMRITSGGKFLIGKTGAESAGTLQMDSGASENGGILDIAGNGWYRYYTRVCRNATSVSTAGYWHIKTNIAANSNTMFLAKFYGYIYGSAQILDLQHAGYAYSGTSSVINQATTNNGSDPNASSAIYVSANGSKVTFRIAFGSGSNFSTYFAGVFMDIAFPSPAGQGHDFEIEAQTFSTSTTVY